MASVFKRGRWVDAQGRKCTKDTPGVTWHESRFWTVKVYIDGKPKVMKGYSDKQASEQMGSKLERAKAQGSEGLIDLYKAHRGRPLVEHVREYVAELRTLGRDAMYVYNAEKRLAKLLALCGWKLLGDISADAFCHWREAPIKQRMADSDDGRIGPRTLNQYLETLRAFCRWCVKRKRVAANPLADVEKVNQTSDVRRARRALSEDELNRLLAVVPEEYQLAYRMILATGLRRDELRQLRWSDVHLDSPSPFIALRADTTKAKRGDVLPIRADLAARLRQARGEDGERVIDAMPTIVQHRSYLAAAGIDWKDAEGRRADIHALRHTYGTMLSKAGVAPREAMSLMRHTDLRLTMNVYTDPRIFDLASAVEKLPIPASSIPAKAIATGTDGELRDVAKTGVANRVARLGFARHSLASTGTPCELDRSENHTEKPRVWHGLAHAGMGGEEKRAKGVEPSTFTLAT